MPTRHRIPTIFNLSMVDVLCCALGCVILLWLLNLREAKQRAAAAGEADTLLNQARGQLDETGQQLRAALSQGKTVALERDRLGRELAAARLRISELDKSIASLRSDRAGTEERLAKKIKEHEGLVKEMVAARKRLAALDVLVRDKDMMAQTSARTAADVAERLRNADARVKQLQAQADTIPGLRTKLTAAEAQLQSLAKEIDDDKTALARAGQTIQLLQDEKRLLADQTRRARESAENRFAGITLTGRRVVFLVDMSGSMEMVDENTPAPDKWTAVRQTMAQIMRSLPDLEKFQVILFSNKITYLLANEGGWVDYDAATSTGRVARALAAVKPTGETDMYAAFDAAFRLKPVGLDTIYVLSDGLPNIGQGLTAEAARTLKETEQTEILSKHVRQTLKNVWNRAGTNQMRVRINAVGFFYESPDVGAFLWALARENDGSFVGMSKP